MGLPVIIFFSFIILALIALLIINKFATKYLNGDFLPEGPDKDETEGAPFLLDVEDDIGEAIPVVEERSRVDPAPFKSFSQKAAMKQIQGQGFDDPFAACAKISVTLDYKSQLNLIYGTIRSIEGLSASDPKQCPEFIRFHVKITPSHKYRTKTPWKSPSSKVLALNFRLGPLKDDLDPKSFICIRLYGKKKTKNPMKRPKCYGECSVLVSRVLTAGVCDTVQRLLPKTNSSFKKDCKAFTSSSSFGDVRMETNENVDDATATSPDDALSDAVDSPDDALSDAVDSPDDALSDTVDSPDDASPATDALSDDALPDTVDSPDDAEPDTDAGVPATDGSPGVDAAATATSSDDAAPASVASPGDALPDK